jgi:hypothetical protein
MHFIVDYFRCYQEREELLEPPFSEAQTRAIKAGRVPGGDL